LRLSDLKNFFEEKISATDLSEIIQAEMNEYRRGSLENGRSMPVLLVDDIELFVHEISLTKLIMGWYKEELSSLEINYIVDSLLLSQNVSFINEDMRNLIETLTDPAVNGPLTKEKMLEILSHLKE